jgi:hypothetical protein
MAESPKDRRKGFRSIEGGLSGLPRLNPPLGDALDFSSVDRVRLYEEAAQRIISTFESDPNNTRSNLSIWNVDVEDEELIGVMRDWQNYPDKDQFDRVCAFAREYLRRLNAGILNI